MFSKLAEKLNKKLNDNEEEIEFKKYDDEEKAQPQEKPAPARSSVINAGADSNIELKLAHPESFSDVADIADYLLDGCTVVLNLEAMDRAECLRMLDFLNGVTYTTGGDIKPVAQNTYIITPNNVDVQGDN